MIQVMHAALKSLRRIDCFHDASGTSKLPGRLTCPLRQTIFGPGLFSVPMDRYQSAPLTIP